LLVDTFQLPLASSGTFEATGSDTETRRDVRCTPAEASAKAGVPSANEAFAGPYLFEASATLPDGRIVGNRSIICVNDYLLTQKRTPTTAIMRLAKMSDASSVAGVTIRAVTEDNIELARAVTEKNGIAEFPKDKVFPKRAMLTRRIRICSSRTLRAAQRCNLPKRLLFPQALIPLPRRTDRTPRSSPIAIFIVRAIP